MRHGGAPEAHMARRGMLKDERIPITGRLQCLKQAVKPEAGCPCLDESKSALQP